MSAKMPHLILIWANILLAKQIFCNHKHGFYGVGWYGELHNCHKNNFSQAIIKI